MNRSYYNPAVYYKSNISSQFPYSPIEEKCSVVVEDKTVV